MFLDQHSDSWFWARGIAWLLFIAASWVLVSCSAPTAAPATVHVDGTCVHEIRAWTDADEALYEQYERLRAAESAMKACAGVR